MRRAALPFSCLLGTVAAACGEPAAPPALAVAGVAFSDFQIELLTSDERESLADLAAFALAVQQGRADSLGAPFRERERRGLLLQKLATELATRSTGLDDAELERMYLEDPEPELVVRHLVVLAEAWEPEARRDSARLRATAALARIRRGAPFAGVAGEVSEEPGAAERGGLLQPGREGSWVSEFWRAALALPTGGVSDVVETEYGYHVLKLEERRAVPFREARARFLAGLVLGAGLDRAQDVADSLTAQVRTDTAAIERWRTGEQEEDVRLARWPGGAFTGGEWRAYLSSLEPDAHARLEAAAPADYRTVVASAASNDRLVDRAEGLGLQLSEPEIVAVRRRWQERVERWIVALELHRGMSVEDIAEHALALLGSDRQGVVITRSELRDVRPALRHLYLVRASPAAPTR